MRVGDVGFDQVLRIGDDNRHVEPRIAVWRREAIEVLLQPGIGAVGNSVLSQVAGPETSRDHSELPLARVYVLAAVLRRLTPRERTL